jgi:hypothetical protein
MSRPVVTLMAGVDQDHRHVMILDLESLASWAAVVARTTRSAQEDKSLVIVATVVDT